ncbi:MAG: PAS domain S-box protein [Dehalococcoidia bacterium]|nr:MAG: PAS domain S-box protein [Dehalococcoidia bacterium]
MMPKKSVAVVVSNFAIRMAGRDVPPYEVEVTRQDGEPLTMEVSAVAIRKQGRIVADLAVMRDVTARKRAEENLKGQKELIDRILSTMPNAVAVLDKDFRIVLANQALSEAFAVRRDELHGRQVDEFLPAEELRQGIAKALQGRLGETRLEFRRVVADRERILVADLFAMNKGETLLVLTDITDERDRQERLYLTDRLASVGEMASGIAHELNNPLTSVIGLSELLSEEDIPEELREDVQAINEEAQRAAVIVRNLLTFARKHPPTRQPTQINDVMQDVLKLRAYEHRVNNIEVALYLQPELPLVSVDYFQMQQVFLNVILNAENAVKDANDGGTVSISSERVDGHVRVCIADDGLGISRENMARIFDPFFTTKEVGKGTGLGLSICYGIMSQHGGRIYAESESGHGATFTIELPV